MMKLTQILLDHTNRVVFREDIMASGGNSDGSLQWVSSLVGCRTGNKYAIKKEYRATSKWMTFQIITRQANLLICRVSDRSRHTIITVSASCSVPCSRPWTRRSPRFWFHEGVQSAPYQLSILFLGILRYMPMFLR